MTMAAKEVYVTPGEVKAAQMLIEVSDDLGRPVSDSVRKIAHATVRPATVKGSVTIPQPRVSADGLNEGAAADDRDYVVVIEVVEPEHDS
jgi:hypothetical protein